MKNKDKTPVCNFWRLGLLLALVLLAMAASAQIRYAVTDLGTLQGGFFSCAMGLNNHGWTEVMDTRLDDSGNLQLRSRVTVGGVKIDLGTLGGPNSWTNWGGINESGRAVGFAETSTLDPNGEDFCFFGTHLTCRPFLWAGDMRALPTLGGNNGQASAINSRGQIVGTAETPAVDSTCPPNHVAAAVLWQDGSPHELPTIGDDPDGFALGINDLGQAVGYTGTCINSVHAVLWEDGDAIELPNLGTDSSNLALAINNQKQIVGQAGSPDGTTFYATLWQDGSVLNLGVVAGDFASFASGINNKGQIVGTSLDGSFNPAHAFIWQKGTMTDLSTLFPSGSSLFPTMANKINSRGQISGMATVVSGPHAGEIHAFLATPVYGVAAGMGNKAIFKPVMPANIRNILLRKLGLGRVH